MGSEAVTPEKPLLTPEMSVAAPLAICEFLPGNSPLRVLLPGVGCSGLFLSPEKYP
jgi:hypothetical protein